MSADNTTDRLLRAVDGRDDYLSASEAGVPGWEMASDEVQRVVQSALRLERMRKYGPTFPCVLIGREKALLARRVEELVNMDDIEPVTQEQLDAGLLDRD